MLLRFFIISLLAVVFLALPGKALADGPCVGEQDCTVCTDCSRCKYCSIQGNECGVCSASAGKVQKTTQSDLVLFFKIVLTDLNVSRELASILAEYSEGNKTNAEALQETAELTEYHRENLVALIETRKGGTLLLSVCNGVAQEKTKVVPLVFGWSDPTNGVLSKTPPPGWTDAGDVFRSADGEGVRLKATPKSIASIQGTALANLVIDLVNSTRGRIMLVTTHLDQGQGDIPQAYFESLDEYNTMMKSLEVLAP